MVASSLSYLYLVQLLNLTNEEAGVISLWLPHRIPSPKKSLTLKKPPAPNTIVLFIGVFFRKTFNLILEFKLVRWQYRNHREQGQTCPLRRDKMNNFKDLMEQTFADFGVTVMWQSNANSACCEVGISRSDELMYLMLADITFYMTGSDQRISASGSIKNTCFSTRNDNNNLDTNAKLNELLQKAIGEEFLAKFATEAKQLTKGSVTVFKEAQAKLEETHTALSEKDIEELLDDLSQRLINLRPDMKYQADSPAKVSVDLLDLDLDGTTSRLELSGLRDRATSFRTRNRRQSREDLAIILKGKYIPKNLTIQETPAEISNRFHY